MNIIADTHTAYLRVHPCIQLLVRGRTCGGTERALCGCNYRPRRGDAGSPQPWYFHNMHVIPRILEGVIVLRGQECNVLDYEGHIDLRQDDEPVMDWIVASMHTPTMPKVPIRWRTLPGLGWQWHATQGYTSLSQAVGPICVRL